MRTKLDDYCQQFTQCLDPLLAPLDAAGTSLEQATHGTPAKELLPTLASMRHDLRALGDKVRGQQAYVLIFGPLKSGKSTLMNGLAGAYVSEVSSLPAYPCLVFVGGGTGRDYRITRYDGTQVQQGDAKVLAKTIDTAHTDLAAAIRRAEQQNLAFDPQEHLPSAIRRVDVRLPDSDLQGLGAVLVDTPGLYTRMRFGYDRLTRDFRDAAACAIFVVRSDTLFLEQVFAEFDALLDLFSRVFLVVNVDSGKRDIGPDGQLVPSLEQSAPDAILQAFRQLAMPAAMHRAAAEGRLRMFPVDLLRAAAAVLQRRELPTDFAAFHGELGTFLGSDEYLAAFRRDSLRRADRLTGELAAALDAGPLRQLHQRIDELQQQLEFAQAELDLLRRAAARDFGPAFGRCERVLAEELERTARDAGHKLLRAMGASIDTWFLSGHSLHWLLHDHWQPLLADYRAEVASAALRTIEQGCGQPDVGLDLPGAVSDLCERRDLDLRRLRREAITRLGPPPNGTVPQPVAVDTIPLKKGLFDLVAFRSLEAVRRRLFGPRECPDIKIPAKEKAARLGEAGRLHLHQCLTQLRASLVPAAVTALQQHYGTALQQATIAALQEALRAELAPIEAAVVRVGRELERLRALQRPLDELQRVVTERRRGLTGLARAFGADLATPPTEREVVLEPNRRPATRDGRPEAKRH